jgi:hypothetical protein
MSDTDALAVGETTPNATESDIPGLTSPEVEQVETKPAEQEQPEQKKMVPYDALHEERQRRKELQAQIERDRAERMQRDAVLEQRLAQLQQATQPKQPQVNFEEDPVRFLALQTHQTQQQIAEMRAQQEMQQQSVARAQQFQQFATGLRNIETEFAKKAPDYDHAIEFAKAKRVEQLRIMGMPDQQAWEQVQSEAFQIAYSAIQRGENPAELGYQYARSVGYQPKTVSPEQQMQAAQKGAEAAKSLSGGGAKGGNTSLEALANMSNEEFDAYVQKHGWEKVMG